MPLTRLYDGALTPLTLKQLNSILSSKGNRWTAWLRTPNPLSIVLKESAAKNAMQVEATKSEPQQERN
jgi:hypothetical protein